jgi:DNA-binding MarR family transcriptional regulator
MKSMGNSPKKVPVELLNPLSRRGTSSSGKSRVAASGPVLGRLLHDVARLRRRAFNILSEPSGLTRTQYWLLSFVEKNGETGLTQSQIAVKLDIGKVAVGSTIDRLVARGLVRRGADFADRRIKPLFVTAKGRKALESMQKVRPIIDDLVFRGMAPETQHALINSLSHVRTNIITMLEQHGSEAGMPTPRKRPRKVTASKSRLYEFTSFG